MYFLCKRAKGNDAHTKERDRAVPLLVSRDEVI
jgi:hypothetical protein